MTQPTILITGCSSGIGLDAAHTLNKRGWRVFATCRSQQDCDKLINDGLESFVLDYASTDSIKAAVAQTLELTDGKLDALFNNGAFAIPGRVEDLPRDAMRSIFETNVFGQFELINCVLPQMRKNNRGRIINNSSVLGFAALPYRGAYVATKFAMEGLPKKRYMNRNWYHACMNQMPRKTGLSCLAQRSQTDLFMHWSTSIQNRAITSLRLRILQARSNVSTTTTTATVKAGAHETR